MGRKSNSKQTTKRNDKINKINQQKRSELYLLVDALFKLTRTFQTSTNYSKLWEHHLEIDKLIKEIISLEKHLLNEKWQGPRQSRIEQFLSWLTEHGAEFDGIEIESFKEFDLGLKATKPFKEGSLLLTIPENLMMTEKNAKESELAEFIQKDPLLQNMPNITLALFLLLEKYNPESFWKPYIDVLPEKYTTILYFTADELLELKPSPVLDTALNLYRSVARQYAYFYIRMYMLDMPVLKKLREIFTFENYRWAASAVMTRQNSLPLDDESASAFIPLWDMCNHEHGKITTDFNKDLNRSECYALRDFAPGDQIFIFYGLRSNAELFIHNGFVYPDNEQDSLSIALGVSAADPLRNSRRALLARLGLAGLTHCAVRAAERPVPPELLAFIRIFNMDQDELDKWTEAASLGDLVSSEPISKELDTRAYNYLLTRCRLIRATYKLKDEGDDASVHRKNIQLLKKCEMKVLDYTVQYLEQVLSDLSSSQDADEEKKEVCS